MLTLEARQPGGPKLDQYYHLELKPAEEFVLFITDAIGVSGKSRGVVGLTPKGEWQHHKWLINKEDAKISGDGTLVSKDPTIDKILDEYFSHLYIRRTGDRLKIEDQRRSQGSTQKISITH